MIQLKRLLFLFIFLTIFINAYSQECRVLPESLKGTYVGDCENGKANGKGKAVGVDSYEGEFKNGYPEGKGSYIWKDGHYFIGQFKKGKKEGKGDIYYESVKGEDSVINGYWKKDEYIGEYEKPYEIRNTSSGISRVNCTIADKKGRGIELNVSRTGGGAMPISDIQILSGTYLYKNTIITSIASITKLGQVAFPFRAIFTFNNGATIEIIFNEKAKYDVNIEVM